MRKLSVIITSFAFALGCADARAASRAVAAVDYENVRLKDLGHIEGVRDNPLVGYGLVVGLAGTGDSARSIPTLQSIANTLSRFGVRITSDQVSSRNVATVMITATLPPFANAGEKLDINVASMGDARSLVGGTLMLAPLKGPDDQIYALAQGPLSVGGYRYDAFGNLVQKNHPTVGQVPGGATLEANVATHIVSPAGTVYVILDSPDYTTASRVAEALSQQFAPLPDPNVVRVTAVDASRIAVRLTDEDRSRLVDVVARIENANVVPDQVARVVVNERTGTVVSGGNVRVGEISVAQGDLKVNIMTDFAASQPFFIGAGSPGVRSIVVPETEIKVDEPDAPSLSMPAGTRVADLVAALNKIKVTPRDIISILQAIKRAGSLHAELVIQ
ncbi:MAG: flagellar basal body P-ring protein FlgI [Nevskia sp.]|nr:flagellar basal body P-ring protein FlgI [Nevskia sp.]